MKRIAPLILVALLIGCATYQQRMIATETIATSGAIATLQWAQLVHGLHSEKMREVATIARSLDEATQVLTRTQPPPDAAELVRIRRIVHDLWEVWEGDPPSQVAEVLTARALADLLGYLRKADQDAEARTLAAVFCASFAEEVHDYLTTLKEAESNEP